MTFNDITNQLYSLPFQGCITDEQLQMMETELASHHKFKIEDNTFINVDELADSPIRAIPLPNIRGVISFSDSIALVLRNSILFFDKHTSEIKIHIKPVKAPITQRMRNFITAKLSK